MLPRRKLYPDNSLELRRTKTNEAVITALPPQVATVADLIGVLRDRGAGYAEAFEHESRVRAALNQEHVHFDATLSDRDELAFFPPVTGG